MGMTKSEMLMLQELMNDIDGEFRCEWIDVTDWGMFKTREWLGY